MKYNLVLKSSDILITLGDTLYFANYYCKLSELLPKSDLTFMLFPDHPISIASFFPTSKTSQKISTQYLVCFWAFFYSGVKYTFIVLLNYVMNEWNNVLVTNTFWNLVRKIFSQNSASFWKSLLFKIKVKDFYQNKGSRLRVNGNWKWALMTKSICELRKWFFMDLIEKRKVTFERLYWE